MGIGGMMTLADVHSSPSGHVDAHNTERHAINDLSDLVSLDQVRNGKPNRRWQTRMARTAAGGYGRISFVGDSITEGLNSGWHGFTIPEQVKNILSTNGLAAQTGLIYLGREAYQVGTLDDRLTSSAPLTMPGGVTHWRTLPAGERLVLDSPQAGTAIDILWLRTGSETLKVYRDFDSTYPDAIPPVIISNTGLQTITGISDQTHSVNIVADGGDAIIGAVGLRHEYGLSIDNAGVGGTQAGDFDVADGWGLAFSVSLTNPDLIVVGLGTNDAYVNKPVATYETELRNLIATFKTSPYNGYSADIVFVAMPTGLNSEGVRISWDPYREILFKLSDEFDIPLIDIYSRWGANYDVSGDPLDIYSDWVHPNSTGYSDIARAIASYILK